jgi:hypothetical protein
VANKFPSSINHSANGTLFYQASLTKTSAFCEKTYFGKEKMEGEVNERVQTQDKH